MAVSDTALISVIFAGFSGLVETLFENADQSLCLLFFIARHRTLYSFPGATAHENLATPNDTLDVAQW